MGLGGRMISEKATYGTNPDVTINLMFRIIRINEDGSVRLITQEAIGYYKFNEYPKEKNASDDNAYMGYMYGTIGSNTYEATHANINASTMKTRLDELYVSNLSGIEDLLSMDAGFCNDRSIAPKDGLGITWDASLGYGKAYTVYGASGRLLTNQNGWITKGNAQPQFKCQQENDLFTTSLSSKGNNKLTYPVGLLTLDEAVYAGMVKDVNNTNVYLKTEDSFWTMTPFFHNGSNALGATVTSSGSLNATYVEHSHGVRPVVNLKSTVKISGGNGTIENPYVVNVNQ